MFKTVRITSKRQISIPVNVFNSLGLKKGDNLLINVDFDNERIIMEKQEKILNQLAGSLKLPKKYKNKSLEQIISDAKRNYFGSKK
jgi:AbrB family looped-hinge helix DNA binding protein